MQKKNQIRVSKNIQLTLHFTDTGAIELSTLMYITSETSSKRKDSDMNQQFVKDRCKNKFYKNVQAWTRYMVIKLKMVKIRTRNFIAGHKCIRFSGISKHPYAN